MSAHAISRADRRDAPIRVLHVDDETEFLDLSTQFFDSAAPNISIVPEQTGSAALDRLEVRDIDCIVSDFDMPEMDGLELFEKVRGRDPGLPFILLTARSRQEIAPRAIHAGVTDCFRKQVDTAHYTLLAHRIEQAVAQHRATRRSKAYALASDAITRIHRGGSVDNITRAICETVCSHDQFDFAWVGFTDDSRTRIEARSAATSESTEHGRLGEWNVANSGPAGIVGDAIETGETHLCTTIEEGAMPDGFVGVEEPPSAAIAIPLILADTPEGVFGVSTNSADGITDSEQRCLEWVVEEYVRILRDHDAVEDYRSEGLDNL